jgi:hypothetical protein
MVLFLMVVTLLLLGVLVAVTAVVGAGRLVGRAAAGRRGGSQAGLARRVIVVLAAGAAVGAVVWASAFLRDPLVVVDGTRTLCAEGIGEDLAPPVQEQCDAQGHDRRIQALVAGATAAAATAIVACSVIRTISPRRNAVVDAPAGEGDQTAEPV